MNTLRLLRNILLRAAAICYCLIAVMAVLTFALWDTWAQTTCTLYHIEPNKLGTLVVYFFALAKFYAIFLLLAPGLAIHWTLKKERPAS